MTGARTPCPWPLHVLTGDEAVDQECKLCHGSGFVTQQVADAWTDERDRERAARDSAVGPLFLTRDGVATYLSCTVDDVDEFVAAGSIPAPVIEIVSGNTVWDFADLNVALDRLSGITRPPKRESMN